MAERSQNKPPVVLKNPYARKKPPPTVTTRSARAPSAAAPARTTTTAIDDHQYHGSTVSNSQHLPQLQPTSFSQAFGTDHEEELSLLTTTTTTNPYAAASTRGMGDASTATSTTAAVSAANSSTTNDVTDREAHVLLPNQPHVLYVSPKQKGNPILPFIRNVPVAYARMVPDFVLAPQRCALFLSCKYHQLYPQYIHRRVAELGHDFTLRVLLVLVDVQDSAAAVRQFNKLCVVNELTLLLAWSTTEAARYLETLKVLDGKDATAIQKKTSHTLVDQVADFVTAAASVPVNRTDAGNLLGQFGSLYQLSQATTTDLALVPGMGPVKVQRLHAAWHAPFTVSRKPKAEPSAPPSASDDKETKEPDDATNTTPQPPSTSEQVLSKEKSARKTKDDTKIETP